MSKNETGMTLSLSHLEPLGVTFSLSIDTSICHDAAGRGVALCRRSD